MSIHRDGEPCLGEMPLDEPNEVERYEQREGPAYRFDANRREFVQALGAGIVVAIAAGGASAQRPNRGGGRRPARAAKLSERFHIGKDGIVTVMTSKVAVTEGRFNILSICQAYECGAILNPTNLRAQVAGAIIMGLGGALFEEVQFKDGRVTNASFSRYRVPRMADVPPIDIELVDRRDLPSVGAGETPIIAIAPAVANAVAHAGGGRMRSLPMRMPVAPNK